MPQWIKSPITPKENGAYFIKATGGQGCLSFWDGKWVGPHINIFETVLEWLEESNEPVFSLQDMRESYECGADWTNYSKRPNRKERRMNFTDFIKSKYNIDL